MNDRENAKPMEKRNVATSRRARGPDEEEAIKSAAALFDGVVDADSAVKEASSSERWAAEDEASDEETLR